MLTLRSIAVRAAPSATRIVPQLRTTFAVTARTLTTTPLLRKEEATLDRAERLKARFWKTVTLKPPSQDNEGFQILLDGRSIRTPTGNPIVIPANRELLAACIAQEWSEQEKTLKPHTLPLTSLAARALEGCKEGAEERKEVEEFLLRYLENETIWYVFRPFPSSFSHVILLEPARLKAVY